MVENFASINLLIKVIIGIIEVRKCILEEPMRVFFIAVSLLMGLTSASLASDLTDNETRCLVLSTTPISIKEDYQPPEEKRPSITDDIKVDEDYSTETKDIALIDPVEKPKHSLAKRATKLIGSVLYIVVDHTARVSLGAIVAHYASDPAGLLASNAIYCLTLSYTGNPTIAYYAKLILTPHIKNATTLLIYYLGTQSPEIVYYSGKTIINTVRLTGQGSKNLLEFIGLLKNEKYKQQLIEMTTLHHSKEGK